MENRITRYLMVCFLICAVLLALISLIGCSAKTTPNSARECVNSALMPQVPLLTGNPEMDLINVIDKYIIPIETIKEKKL